MQWITSLLVTLFTAVPVFADMAFVANLDGNWDLFTVDDDGSHLTRLTKTPYDEKDPVWSPDRQLIAYLTSDGQLNVIHVVTGKTSRIPTGNRNLRKYSPAFSPDGKAIVYAQARSGAGDDSDLLLFNFESSRDRLVIDQHSIQMWPAFSPDGKNIIYANLHCNEACGHFIQELWETTTGGNRARQLLLTNSFCKQPVHSPDGKTIAYASDREGNFDIWIFDFESNDQPRQVTTNKNSDESPAWSPDGTKIAFVSNRSGTFEIWVKNLESGALKKLTPFGGRKVSCRDVAW